MGVGRLVQGDVGEFVKGRGWDYFWVGISALGIVFLTLARAWTTVGWGQLIFCYLFLALGGINNFRRGWNAPKEPSPEQAPDDTMDRVVTKVTALRSDYDEAMLVLERVLSVPEVAVAHPAWHALYEVQRDARTLLARYRASERGQFPDPGKQALLMLQRGDDCDWYSIKHSNEMHEAFDCLEIYWRTKVQKKSADGCSRRFEDRAGFRVRWHVASSNTSYSEAYGLDLMTTILEARELADRQRERAAIAEAMGYNHPALEAWAAGGEKRQYSFHGLDLEKWHVRLNYPGGLSWAEHPDLDQAVADALAKSPEPS